MARLCGNFYCAQEIFLLGVAHCGYIWEFPGFSIFRLVLPALKLCLEFATERVFRIFGDAH